MWFLIIGLYPIGYPIAKLLDRLLGPGGEDESGVASQFAWVPREAIGLKGGNEHSLQLIEIHGVAETADLGPIPQRSASETRVVRHPATSCSAPFLCPPPPPTRGRPLVCSSLQVSESRSTPPEDIEAEISASQRRMADLQARFAAEEEAGGTDVLGDAAEQAGTAMAPLLPRATDRGAGDLSEA